MIEIRKELSLDNIRSQVSDREIMQYIFPNFKRIKSKFSIRKEELPSASIMQGEKDLLIRDFGDPNQNKAESWYEYIMRTECNGNFNKALKWANNTFKLNYGGVPRGVTDPVKYAKDIIHNKEQTIIKIKSRKFEKKDEIYWNQYGISIEKLKSKKIVPIDFFWINDLLIDTRDQLSYAYYLGKENKIDIYKIYSPFNKKFKWVTNSINIIQNLKYISKTGTHLIIQTSYKDCMCMEELGYENIISLPSESRWFTKEQWNLIKSNFPHIIYFANNDSTKENNPGLTYAQIYKDKYNIDFVHTPDGYSDISDYYKSCGKEVTELFLKEILDVFYKR